MNENDNVSVNENDNDDNDNDNESENDYERYQDHKIKQLHNYFKEIDETKSFEEQIEILKKRDYIDEYWHEGYYHGNKELNFKIFKAKFAYLLNDIDENLFEEVFGHTFVALAGCTYIKCFISAKKNTKNAKVRLLTKEDTFG